MLKKVYRVHFRYSWLLGTVSPRRLFKFRRDWGKHPVLTFLHVTWRGPSARVVCVSHGAVYQLIFLCYDMGDVTEGSECVRAWLTLKAFKENRKSRRVYLFALSDHEIMLGHIWTAKFFHAICCFYIFSVVVERTCHCIAICRWDVSSHWDSKAADDIWNNFIFVIWCFSSCLVLVFCLLCVILF